MNVYRRVHSHGQIENVSTTHNLHSQNMAGIIYTGAPKQYQQTKAVSLMV